MFKPTADNQPHKIGDTINVTFASGKTVPCKITGRNWAGDWFVSYIVRHEYCDYPVCPESFKSQVSWG